LIKLASKSCANAKTTAELLWEERMPWREQYDLPRRLAHRVRPIVVEAAVALAMIVLAIGSLLAVNQFFENTVTALIFPAIAGAVLLAGPRSGAITLIGSQLLAWYFLLPIKGSLRFETWDDAVRLVLNTVAELILLWAVSSYRAAAQAAAESEVQRAEGLKDTADRMQVLVAELQHRTRNLLAIVRILAQNAIRESSSLEDFQAKFLPRLGAIARVQGLLSRPLGEGRVTLDALLRAELAAHSAFDDGGARVMLEGPDNTCLQSNAVQILGLALHELATNAIKYGALSQPAGRLAVHWWVESVGENDQHLWIDWREGGVAICQETATPRTGSGRNLIEHALPYQLGVKTTFEFGAEGVHCTLCLPVTTR
jgi:two-component sensor histidine kinase